MNKIKNRNYVSQGWYRIKYWWESGIKGKALVVLVLILSISSTQVIYTTTSNKTNDEVLESTNTEEQSNEALTINTLDGEIKNIILLEISSLYSNSISKMKEFNVNNVDFKSPEDIFNKGSIIDKIYSVNDNGVVVVQYLDGTQLEKEYTLTYKYDLEYNKVLESNINIINLEQDNIKDKDISNIQQNNNVENNVEAEEKPLPNKFDYAEELEKVVVGLMNGEASNNNIRIEKIIDGYDIAMRGDINENIFKIDEARFDLEYWAYTESLGQEILYTGGVLISLEYDINTEKIISSKIDFRIHDEFLGGVQ